jgi:hypothetical protein
VSEKSDQKKIFTAPPEIEGGILGVPCRPGHRQVRVDKLPDSWGMSDPVSKYIAMGYEVDRKVTDTIFVMTAPISLYEEHVRKAEQAAADRRNRPVNDQVKVQRSEVIAASVSDLAERASN